jgi:hypothetical protein
MVVPLVMLLAGNMNNMLLHPLVPIIIMMGLCPCMMSWIPASCLP